MVVLMKKKAKPTTKRKDSKPPVKGKEPRYRKPKTEKTFVRASDYSNRKVGFPNLHVTIAMEALRHAERAKTTRAAMRGNFGDLYRVIDLGADADGFKLQDAMVAALNYVGQIVAAGARYDFESRQARTLVDQIGQFVDMKQVPDGFFVRARREVTKLLATKRVRKRSR